MYVIQNIETGKFVSRHGSYHSYTYKIMEAQVYHSQAAAEKDRCVENERVVSVEDYMAGNVRPPGGNN